MAVSASATVALVGPGFAIFSYLQEAGGVTEEDMYEAFNMGVGYVIVVKSELEARVIESVSQLGENAYSIGEVQKGVQPVVLS